MYCGSQSCTTARAGSTLRTDFILDPDEQAEITVWLHDYDGTDYNLGTAVDRGLSRAGTAARACLSRSTSGPGACSAGSGRCCPCSGCSLRSCFQPTPGPSGLSGSSSSSAGLSSPTGPSSGASGPAGPPGRGWLRAAAPMAAPMAKIKARHTTPDTKDKAERYEESEDNVEARSLSELELPVASEEPVSVPRLGRKSEERDDVDEQRRRPAPHGTVGDRPIGRRKMEPDRPAQDTSAVDLVTVAGLATWTDQVMGKIGKDNLESLLAVSEITGRLSKDVKEIVFSLAHLYGDRDKEGVLTARETVSLLAQLDALTGTGTSADAKILPLLMKGEVEGPPSTQS